MRISDWSSDVCSSDLLGALAQGFVFGAGVCRSRCVSGCAGSIIRARRNFRYIGCFADGAQPVSVRQLSAYGVGPRPAREPRSEEHTSELQSLMRTSYAVFCLKKKNNQSHFITCNKKIQNTHI